MRHICPSEHHTSAPLPTINQPDSHRWLTLVLLTNSLIDYIVRFCSDDTPAIIEYSDSEVKRMIYEAKIKVEAQIAELPEYLGTMSSPPANVELILVLVQVRDDEEGQTVSIKAKPKRVRQLLKDHGVRGLAGDVYGAQIKEALQRVYQAE